MQEVNLSSVPTEELRKEIKRRNKIARMEAKLNVPKYAIWTAVVHRIKTNERLGKTKYFVKDASIEVYEFMDEMPYELKRGAFKSVEKPKLGDVVELQYKPSKDYWNSKITRVISRK